MGQAILELLINYENIVLINKLRIACPNKMSMSFCSFSDNLLQGAYTMIQNHGDDFEIVYKTCSIFTWGTVFFIGFVETLNCLQPKVVVQHKYETILFPSHRRISICTTSYCNTQAGR